jgi:hypothetical protein
MSGINTLLQLGKGAGLNIPQGVVDAGMFIGNPGMFMLNKALGALEARAGLPVGIAQAAQNPKGELIDYAKTQAKNSILDTNDVSNLEALLYQLQPNQFDQARSAGENATPVNSSIADFEMTPNDLSSMFGNNDNIMQAAPTSGGKTDFESLLASYAHGGQVCGCKR